MSRSGSVCQEQEGRRDEQEDQQRLAFFDCLDGQC